MLGITTRGGHPGHTHTLLQSCASSIFLPPMNSQAIAISAGRVPTLPRHVVIAVGVVLFHVLALWALQSGLLRRAVEVPARTEQGTGRQGQNDSQPATASHAPGATRPRARAVCPRRGGHAPTHRPEPDGAGGGSSGSPGSAPCPTGTTPRGITQ